MEKSKNNQNEQRKAPNYLHERNCGRYGRYDWLCEECVFYGHKEYVNG